MAHKGSVHRIDNALSDVSACVPAHDATARQNEVGEDSPIGPLLLPHVQAARPQPVCAPLLYRLCTDCGYQEEDWTRRVEYVSSTNSGDEISATGVALFDTGANLDNLLSLDFVTQCSIHFEPWIHVKEIRLPWWKRACFRMIGKRSQAKCYTVDQRPITVVGVVKNLRWRGIPEPRCNSGLRFPQKFLDGGFLVVKNLAYDAIFSSKTMNDAGLRGSCNRAVSAVQPPKPTQDPNAAKKSKDAKKEQKKIQQSREQGKRCDKGEKKPLGK